jgi:thiol-disulfide isomerase/thioredoxin
MEIHYIGASWCAPCRTIKPQMIELCKKYSVPLKIYDLETDLEASEVEKITKIPTVRIYKEGTMIAEHTTAQVAQTATTLAAHVTLGGTDADF